MTQKVERSKAGANGPSTDGARDGAIVRASGIHAHLAREFRRLSGYLVAVRRVYEGRRRTVVAAARQKANSRHGYDTCRGERDQ